MQQHAIAPTTAQCYGAPVLWPRELPAETGSHSSREAQARLALAVDATWSRTLSSFCSSLHAAHGWHTLHRWTPAAELDDAVRVTRTWRRDHPSKRRGHCWFQPCLHKARGPLLGSEVFATRPTPLDVHLRRGVAAREPWRA